MTEPDPRVGRGRGGEAVAEAYLRGRGYELLARRFRVRNGEIDLVMRDGATVVFVEVRTRASARYGDPLESISPRKRSTLVRSARLFLAARGLHAAPCRFDVVSVRLNGAGAAEVVHRSDAFRADGRFS